jgi:hypothetical protein
MSASLPRPTPACSRSGVYRRLYVGRAAAADQHRSGGFRHSGHRSRLACRLASVDHVGLARLWPDLSAALPSLSVSGCAERERTTRRRFGRLQLGHWRLQTPATFQIINWTESHHVVDDSHHSGHGRGRALHLQPTTRRPPQSLNRAGGLRLGTVGADFFAEGRAASAGVTWSAVSGRRAEVSC